MNLADKTFINIIAKSSEALFLLVSSIVMVRAFPKADVGTYLQIMLITNTAAMFAFLGFPQSIFYFFPQAANQRQFIIRNAILSLGISCMTAGIVYVLHGQLASWFNNPFLQDFGWIAPLLIALRSPSLFREPFLISHESLVTNSILVVLCNSVIYLPIIVAALLSVSLVALLKVMLAFSGVELFIYLGTILWLMQKARLAEQQDTERGKHREQVTFRQQCKYAFPIAVSSYMGIIGRKLDQYIVSIFFIPQDFAVYSRGAMEIPLVSKVQYIINNIMMPKYVQAYRRGDMKAFLSHYHLCIENVAKINFPSFGLLFAVAPSVVTFLYTEEYIGSAAILRVYLCLLLTGITVYAAIPRASGHTSCIMYATAISITGNIIFSLILVSQIGAIGAAIATILSIALSSLYFLMKSCKILGISFREIFPWKFLGQLLGVCLLSSLPVYVIERLIHVQGKELFFLLVFEGLIYTYFCVFLMLRKHLFRQNDLDQLRKWFRFDVQRFLHKITFLS